MEYICTKNIILGRKFLYILKITQGFNVGLLVPCITSQYKFYRPILWPLFVFLPNIKRGKCMGLPVLQ